MFRKIALVVLLIFVCLISLCAAASQQTAQPATATDPPEWTEPFPPFRIIANVYYVGTYDLACYLITTPKGHILINSGLRSSVPQIEANVRKLGFKMSDIKILAATHAHVDHVGALAELKKITGARMAATAEDADVLEAGGHNDFRWGNDPNFWFDPVKVDQRLKDGDTIELGGTLLTVHLHPGHTKGATSFTFPVTEGGKTYRVGIMNLGSINPGVRVSGMPTYPNIANDYARTFREQKAMTIDVFLSSHASQFRMHEKYKPGDRYDPARFVDPAGFHAEVEELEKAYQAQLENERQGMH